MQLDPLVGEVLRELGAQPRADELPAEAVLVAAGREVEGEDVLEVMTSPSMPTTSEMAVMPARAVLEAGLLDDQVERAGDLLADGAHRQARRPP